MRQYKAGARVEKGHSIKYDSSRDFDWLMPETKKEAFHR